MNFTFVDDGLVEDLGAKLDGFVPIGVSFILSLLLYRFAKMGL